MPRYIGNPPSDEAGVGAIFRLRDRWRPTALDKWDLLMEDFNNLDAWTDADTGNGVSEIDPAGQLHQDSVDDGSSSTVHTTLANGIPLNFTSELKIKITTFGWTQSATLRWETKTGATAISHQVQIKDDGALETYDDSGSTYRALGITLSAGTWATVRVVVHTDGTKMDAYLDGVEKNTNVTTGFGGGTDGKITIIANPNALNRHKHHVDFIYVNTGAKRP